MKRNTKIGSNVCGFIAISSLLSRGLWPLPTATHSLFSHKDSVTDSRFIFEVSVHEQRETENTELRKKREINFHKLIVQHLDNSAMDIKTKRSKNKIVEFSDIGFAEPSNESSKKKTLRPKVEKQVEPDQEKVEQDKVDQAKERPKEEKTGNDTAIKDMQSAVVAARNLEIARSRFLSLIGITRPSGGEPSQRYTCKDEKAADKIARDFVERL